MKDQNNGEGSQSVARAPELPSHSGEDAKENEGDTNDGLAKP